AAYREVARMFAGQGRLVQAIAVCKGILEIDPRHLETQNMLAELVARRRPARKQPTLRLQQQDGRWVAIPVPAESGLLQEGEPPAAASDDAPPPAPSREENSLDFPAETKARARGGLLLDLPPAPGASLDLPPAPDAEATRAASPSTLRKQVLDEAL